jgi:8-oxo-dGTP diphosphatase
MTPSRGSSRKGKGRARRESSAGGVVFRAATQENKSPLFLLICDSYGKWGFPKGHLERGERADTAALREVMEETGLRSLNLVSTTPIATIEWFFRLHGDLIHKNCRYFLMETSVERTKPQKSEGISACRWATEEEARELLSYNNAREVLQRAHELVLSRRSVATASASD